MCTRTEILSSFVSLIADSFVVLFNYCCSGIASHSRGWVVHWGWDRVSQLVSQGLCAGSKRRGLQMLKRVLGCLSVSKMLQDCVNVASRYYGVVYAGCTHHTPYSY